MKTLSRNFHFQIVIFIPVQWMKLLNYVFLKCLHSKSFKSIKSSRFTLHARDFRGFAQRWKLSFRRWIPAVKKIKSEHKSTSGGLNIKWRVLTLKSLFKLLITKCHPETNFCVFFNILMFKIGLKRNLFLSNLMFLRQKKAFYWKALWSFVLKIHHEDDILCLTHLIMNLNCHKSQSCPAKSKGRQ